MELAKNKIHLPVRLGKPEGVMGINGDLTMATVCGLVLIGADLEGKEGGSEILGKVTSKIKRIFKNFIP